MVHRQNFLALAQVSRYEQTCECHAYRVLDERHVFVAKEFAESSENGAIGPRHGVRRGLRKWQHGFTTQDVKRSKTKTKFSNFGRIHPEATWDASCVRLAWWDPHFASHAIILSRVFTARKETTFELCKEFAVQQLWVCHPQILANFDKISHQLMFAASLSIRKQTAGIVEALD